MRLFIAEKPNMGREIASVLGAKTKGEGFLKNNNGDVVTWCFGHILQQFEPNDYKLEWDQGKFDMSVLPMIPDTFKHKVKKDCAKQYKVIKELISEADVIVNAGDPDREGQLLVDEVLDYCKNKKPVKRILLNALDEKSIKKALNDLRDNKDFLGMKNAALARERADWLHGMNLSRAYTIASHSGISVGRVQTPTLALVVRREEEIKNFKETNYFLLKVKWDKDKSSVISSWDPQDTDEGFDSENRLIDKNIALKIGEKVKATDKGIVKSVSEDKKKEAPMLPYSLSSLQIAAGKKFGYSPQTVLDAMQSLYEQKLTTYPRSDCNYIPVSQFEDASVIISNLGSLNEVGVLAKKADTSLKSKAFNDKKITAHHAIIPTTVKASSFKNDTEKNLYLMVAKAYIAQFFSDFLYLSTKVCVESAGEKFIITGKKVLDQGWKLVFDKDLSDDKKSDDDSDQVLPAFKEGDVVSFIDYSVVDKVTKPPTRFTDSSLLQAMKDIHKYIKDKAVKDRLKTTHGIGTEATRAGIIDKLHSKEFLSYDAKKKYVLPSPKAVSLIHLLPEAITVPDMTALWEDKLELIVSGEFDINTFLNSQITNISSIIGDVKSGNIDCSSFSNKREKVLVGKCPVCGKNVYENKVGYSCEGNTRENPSCKFILWADNKAGILKGKKLSLSSAKSLLSGKTVLFKGCISSKGTKYDASLKLDKDGKFVFVNSKK